MEPALIPYSPILHRPPLRWPNGAASRCGIVPNIEHYEYLPKFVRTRDPWPRSPHRTCWATPRATTAIAFGLWRLFDLTDAFGIRCTVSLNMTVIQHYPAILEAMDNARLGVHVARHLQHPLTTGISPQTKNARRCSNPAPSTAPSPAGSNAAGSARRSPTPAHLRSRRRVRLRLHRRPVSRRPAVPRCG